LPEHLTVGGYLDLEGCTGITSLPEHLTVGGYLDLEGCTGITSLPEHLTVGGNLYLRGTGITSLPEYLTVGGNLYLRGTGIENDTNVNYKLPKDFMVFTWQNGKYIKADGIFMEVISRKGRVYRVKNIGENTVSYLITDGNGKWSHGDTLKDARESLIYKIGDRDKSEYKSLSTDSSVSVSYAIEMYRVITGACSYGTRNFIENILTDKKEKYTVKEIAELTNGQWGNSEFKNFFNL
jgi:hypothetical protein